MHDDQLSSRHGKGEEIAALLQQGYSYREIRAKIGCSRSAISYHANRIGHNSPNKGSDNRYDWEKIRAYYEQGHSMKECMSEFGFSQTSWNRAVGREKITPRSNMLSLEELLVANRVQTKRAHLKKRLKKAGLLSTSCAICGISDWNGKPLTLELDHINGDKHDNRQENLRSLCPNCHSQTDTYSRLNVRKKQIYKEP